MTASPHRKKPIVLGVSIGDTKSKNFFCCIKGWRRIATRYNTLACAVSNGGAFTESWGSTAGSRGTSRL
jgi:hypothetical protein